MPGTTRDRRIDGEWHILQTLAALNEDRIGNLQQEEAIFRVDLRQTPALALDGVSELRDHRLRVEFPRFYPAMPMDLYLEQPVFHPNVHPETGFVCLWDRHRAGNTIEHALHKSVAILGWRLMNDEALHCMQEAAARRSVEERHAIAVALYAPSLQGSTDDSHWQSPNGPSVYRRRLS